ncbi:MAG: adenine-specific methyltransferase EcoRI family protein [Cetobacterium sp.]|uniref:adenine-specific methyltransferase EcoRI family protein n=1 Tax=Cetobacterium sp. TaxID=2071632 RepID=UPI003EE6906F
MGNTNLHSAKRAKNDEFYTQWADIERELAHYQDKFRDKTVYLNCDSAKSNFWLYFRIRFEHFGIKKLIATHYDPTGGAYKLVYEGGKGVYHPSMGEEGLYTSKTSLEGDGDFRSNECLQLLTESDVVVTNPPFSLFREFVDLLNTVGKEFLIVGSMNAITYKNIFTLIKDNLLWLGVNPVKRFLQPDGSFKSFGNICWFTNLDHQRRNEEVLLWREYSSDRYPHYDNYDAIEVSKVTDIPCDWGGVMGVPITFLTKYNPNQFEILDINPHFFSIVESGQQKPKQLSITGQKDPYARILITKKVTNEG